jgi:hypothetical protein
LPAEYADLPGPLLDLMRQWGVGRVERAVIAALGFPAGWVETGREIGMVREWIEINNANVKTN